MKKLAILVLTIVVFSTTNAQQMIATLNHNDTISVYYGINALQQSYEAAVNGDIITLSPGTFNSVGISKLITLRGAGMYPDTVAGTEATVIQGISINVGTSTEYTFTMEGISISGTMYVHHGEYLNFIKCYFNQVHPSTESTTSGDYHTVTGLSFINCIIGRFVPSYSQTGTYGIRYGGNLNYTQFINSVILELGNGNTPSLYNCVAYIYPANNITISNSIVFCNIIADDVNALSSFNSIGIYTGTGDTTYFHYDNLGDHNLSNYSSFDSVFSTFRGTYNQGVDFHLLESIANTHRGADGTEMGIYGGQYPFDPRVSIPTMRINAARRSNANGNLEVNVEVNED